MRRILLHIIAIALNAAGFAIRFFPLKHRVVFMSRQSEKLSLDFHLLMDWLEEEKPDIPIEVSLSSPESKGVLPFAFNTLRQLRLVQTSSVVVVDGYVPAVSVPIKRKGVTVIQLWHAMGAIKKFGYQCLDTPDGRDSESAKILRMHKNYDYVIAGGKWAVDHLSAAFDIDPESVIACGLPRCEYLLSDDYTQLREEKIEEIIKAYPRLKNGKKCVLYAPTFRRTDMSFGASLFQDACDCFSGEPINLIYSGHPLGEEDLAEFSIPENVIVGQGFRTIDWLLLADVMITDYSAVAYEAALVRKPVLFYVPDIEAYRKSPGLNVDPLFDYPDCASTNMRNLMVGACSSQAANCDFVRDIVDRKSRNAKKLTELIEACV